MSGRCGAYQGPLFDFHAHLQIRLENRPAAQQSPDLTVPLRDRSTSRDPLAPWLRRFFWLNFERLGYMYAFRRGSPLEKPMERTLSRIIRAMGPGDRAELTGEMDLVGIDRSVILAVPPVATNEDVLAAGRASPRLVPFVAPEPCRGDPLPQIAETMAAGGRGVKLHPQLQNVAVAGEFAIATAQEAGRRGVPLVIHCGGTPFLFGRPAQKRPVPEDYARLAAAAPATSIVIAHSGLWEYPEMIAIAARCHNLILDLSFQSSRAMHRCIEAVGSRRAVVGSDFPMGRIDIVLANLGRLGLPADQVADIVWNNAQRLIGE